MTEMASPIPTHLPRQQDVCSKILNKIDSATNLTLNSALASTWLDELDETIQKTKTHLHGRIHSDLPRFHRQWESAKSIQTRFQTLTDNVDNLSAAVSDPRTGLVPILLRRLSEHSILVQEAADIQSRFEALSHIARCKIEFSNLDTLIKAGKLQEAVIALEAIYILLESAPEALSQSTIFLDLRRKYQSTQALVQEQLSDAYTRSIIISASLLVIRSCVQVRGSDTMLSVSSILSSFTPNLLDQHLATLRRDILVHFIGYVLRQPSSVSITSIDDTEYSVSLTPAPPNNESRSTRIDNLSQILSFFSSHFFPILPPSVSSNFPQSLFKPTTATLLNDLLIPSLPSSFGLLPPFLELARRAVTFESEAVTLLEHNSTAELPLRTWVEGLAAHYEKQRRLQLLDNCRMTILTPEDSNDRFKFEIEIPSEPTLATIVAPEGSMADKTDIHDFKDDAWGFDDEADVKKPMPPEEPETSKEDDYQDDAWGFDDDDPVQDEQPPAELEIPTSTLAESIPFEEDNSAWQIDDEDLASERNQTNPSAESVEGKAPGDPESLSDEAWGWNDNTEGLDDATWDDDPWANVPPEDESLVEKVEKVAFAPKAATRLEKAASKAKKPINGHTTTMVSVPESVSVVQTYSTLPPSQRITPPSQSISQLAPHHDDRWQESAPPCPPPTKRPSDIQTNILQKESYMVPTKAKQIIKTVENIIEECKQFQASSLFPVFPPATPSPSSQPGAILAQTPASLIDLYIAMYPTKFGTGLLESVQKGILFSNGCLYMAYQLEGIQNSLGMSSGFGGLKERLEECSKNLEIIGESWYEQVVQTRCEKVDSVLVDGAKGFANTSDQSRYDECETAINQVVQEIKRFSQQLRGVLTKGKYYTAIGLVTEAALSRILQDILALSDIPEVDSHQLSELCRILNSLEGLFHEDTTQASAAVAYVPSWLKFNYLSELLEASMADISYLFEEGALVDFEIDELVRLVKALFADTALRTNTMNKLMNGHPNVPVT